MKKIIAMGLTVLSLFIASCLPSNVTPEGQREWDRYERGNSP